MIDPYSEFLRRKAFVDPPTGITGVIDLPSQMFDFQSDITRWALKRGRAALFAGTGLGKSFMELAWADAVHRKTGKDVLHLAPLAVSSQMIAEADKFGISAKHVRAQEDCVDGDNITNYQKLSHFDMSKFGGVILDESSILKNTTGIYRSTLIDQCRDIPFRLAATATPAPNDFMELGNHAEFLGVMSYTDMLSTFFTHDGSETQKWRIKGHAEKAFWRWMSSWAVMLRKPSDLGYTTLGYDLPTLNQFQHLVAADYAPNIETGMLFPMQAHTMQERLAARRGSVGERVAKAASVTPVDRQFVWWCNLNAESEALTKAIPGAVETKGGDSEDVQERKIMDFVHGKTRVLVSKASVCGFGMNFQHCADTGFVGLNDSFEQVFQAIRRFWRFGQTRTVNVHFIASEIEGAVVANLKRKEADADRMAAAMILHMQDMSVREVRGMERDRGEYHPTENVHMPEWLEPAS